MTTKDTTPVPRPLPVLLRQIQVHSAGSWTRLSPFPPSDETVDLAALRFRSYTPGVADLAAGRGVYVDGGERRGDVSPPDARPRRPGPTGPDGTERLPRSRSTRTQSTPGSALALRRVSLIIGLGSCWGRCPSRRSPFVPATTVR